MKLSKKEIINLVLTVFVLSSLIGAPSVYKKTTNHNKVVQLKIVHATKRSARVQKVAKLNSQKVTTSNVTESKKNEIETTTALSNSLPLTSAAEENDSEAGTLYNISEVIKRRKPFQVTSEVFSGNVFDFNPFPEHSYKIVPLKVSNADERTDTLYGNIIDDSGAYLGTASMVRVRTSQGEGVSGTFTLDSGIVFNLGHNENGQSIIEEINENKLPSCGTDDLNTAKKHSHTEESPAQVAANVVRADLKQSAQNVKMAQEESANLIPITIMVLYSPQARSGAGGTAAIEARARESVAVANQDYLNSKINIRLNLVYVGEVSYNEDYNFATNLTRLTGKTDGYMDEVHALRDQYQADMVALLVNSMQYCGLGWLGAPYSWAANYMFTVTNQYCAPFHTLAHELGHNMGANHDKASSGPGGAYTYSYGYHFGKNRYRTVMAYPPGTRVGHFSNPSIKYAGYATGVANKADNARTINNMAPVIAAFRGESFCLTGSVTNDGLPVSGVLISAGALGYRITNSDGAYSFPNIYDGTNYLLQASRSGFTFSPSTVTGVISEDTVEDFVGNNIPLLEPVSSQKLSASAGSIGVAIAAEDEESDSSDMTFSAVARVFNNEYYTKERLQITASFVPSSSSLQKNRKWFKSETGAAYYVVSNGDLFRYNPGSTPTKITRLVKSVYTNPRLLTNASTPQTKSGVTFSMSDDLLTVYANGAKGKFLVTVTVSDPEGGTATRTFLVTVA